MRSTGDLVAINLDVLVKVTLVPVKEIVVARSNVGELHKDIWMEDIVINIMEMEVDSRCKVNDQVYHEGSIEVGIT